LSFVKAAGGDTGRRVRNDYYPTPAIATYALARMIELPTRLWEPAAGRGHMVHELRRLGHIVLATDLHTYPDPLVNGIGTNMDFLDARSVVLVDWGIVTNPPYKQVAAFAERALQLSDFVAFLCRIQFIESQTRLKLFQRYPLTWVLPFSARFDYSEEAWAKRGSPMGGMICNAWFIWDYRYGRPKDDTRLRIIDTPAMMARRAREVHAAA
jgi:hypothetical protein